MGRVLTNNTGLSVTREEPGSIGTYPSSPDWKVLEPNDISNYGAEIATVSREPISKDKQRRKGTTTDLDSAVEYDADLTLDSFEDFIEGFMFVTAVNSDLHFAEIGCSGTGFTVPSGTAAQAAKLQWVSGGQASLIFASGYDTAANNGLFALNADFGATDTEITVTGLTTESAPTGGIVELAGIRPETGDLSIAVSSGVATLTSDNNSVSNPLNFTTLGLTVGQAIHIGGATASNQFSAGAGYGRIVTIAAQTMTLDKLDSTIAADTGASETVDLLFGRFIRNVSVDHADYLETSYQFEASFDNLDSGGATEYEYSKGNLCNQIVMNLSITDKATGTFGFIGTDTEVPTTTRKSLASSPRTATKTAALNTSADIARLRITQVDGTGLTTDFKSLSITLSNNVSPEKILAKLGAAYMNAGNFNVDIEAQILFTNSDVTSAIRNNTTVTMDFRLKNDDGCIAIDIPSMTLGGGAKEFPVNETVLMNTTGEAFKDATLNTSLSVSLFPTVPA